MNERNERPKIDRSPHEKTLVRVMVFGTSLSFGVLAAIVVSMKDFVRGNAAFEFTPWTIVAFVAGCAAGWLFWKLFRAGMKRDNKQSGST